MKLLGNIFRILVLIGGIVALVGQNHFLIGNLLGVILWPLLVGLGIFCWNRRKKPTDRISKALYGLLFFLSLQVVYQGIMRLEWGTRPEKPHQELSLLTYNLFFKNRYPQNILNEIKKTDADIVLVQELTPTWQAHLSNGLGARYPYKKFFARRDAYGLGILSKYPLSNTQLIRYKGGQPIFQICEVRLAQKKAVLVNTHLASPAVAVENPKRFFPLFKENYQIRQAQWQQLVDFFKDKYVDTPKIVVGDFNTMRTEGLYRTIRRSWRDVYTKTNWGLGANFPNIPQLPFPLFTLDYIMIQGKVKPVDAQILKGSSSDHLAIWGKVAL